MVMLVLNIILLLCFFIFMIALAFAKDDSTIDGIRKCMLAIVVGLVLSNLINAL